MHKSMFIKIIMRILDTLNFKYCKKRAHTHHQTHVIQAEKAAYLGKANNSAAFRSCFWPSSRSTCSATGECPAISVFKCLEQSLGCRVCTGSPVVTAKGWKSYPTPLQFSRKKRRTKSCHTRWVPTNYK